MLRFCLFVFVLMLCHVAQADDRAMVARFVPENDQLTVNYTILKNEDLLNTVLDALRAGEMLRVTHVMEFKKRDGWWRDTLARKKASRYLSFNPLKNLYYSGTSAENMVPLMGEELVTGLLYSVERQELLDVNALETGKEYVLYVKVRSEQVKQKEGGWLEFFSLRGLWSSEEINEKVYYIAR